MAPDKQTNNSSFKKRIISLISQMNDANQAFIGDIENIDDMKDRYSCHITLKSNYNLKVKPDTFIDVFVK